MRPNELDFKTYLQLELERRLKKNPRYSLRAFSKALGINAATLSAISRGKRKITVKMIEKLGENLQLSPGQILNFKKQVAVRTNRSPVISAAIPFEQIDEDKFDCQANWIHDAILELSHLPSFKSDPRWIAKVLSTSVTEVNSSLNRLSRLGLIERDGEKLKDLLPANQIGAGLQSSTALRKYQNDLLSVSMTTLSELEKTERDHGSIMLTLPRSAVPEARERIRLFRAQFAAWVRTLPEEHDAVYLLQTALFPLSKTINTEETKQGDQK